MNNEDMYMTMRPFPEQRKARVKLLQSVLLQKESPLVRKKLKMLTTQDAVGDCLLTVDTGESHDRTFLFITPRGMHKERPETPAEKKQREEAIKLLRTNKS